MYFQINVSVNCMFIVTRGKFDNVMAYFGISNMEMRIHYSYIYMYLYVSLFLFLSFIIDPTHTMDVLMIYKSNRKCFTLYIYVFEYKVDIMYLVHNHGEVDVKTQFF